ncbi:FG-GAP repeat domain-containing protein [Colwellia piezophila]|uniref:FG-GAP repeat domain-containing protein n=1 Tax=Colwellia piezophila TaxID=211668 RepID=UPI00039EC769|nr:VCBS repeat-containing protein [Colwellia piezophila]
MKIIRVKVITLICLATTHFTALAFNIDLTIEGQGQVEATSKTCTSSCDIATAESSQTLVTKASPGWYFTGWQGQKCDMGNGVIIPTENQDVREIGSAAGGAKSLETIDINNDGIDDLIGISLFNGKVNSYENLGDGTFISKTIISDLAYPSSLDSYDWNNDGYKDLFVTQFNSDGRGIKMYLNDGNGGFVYEKTFTFENTRPYSFSVIDYDLDSRPDFVISSFDANTNGDLFTLVESIENEKISWFKNTDQGFKEQQIIAEKAAITLDTYQAHENAIPQILTAEIQLGEIAVYSNENGKDRKLVSSKWASYGAAFGDIDENGHVDILTAHYKPSILSLFYGLGEGEYSKSVNVARPEEGVTATAFGDFNNDSYIDVATGEFNNKKFYYYATAGFDQCIVIKSSSLALTAIFKKDESASSDSEKKSGGSLTWLLFVLVPLLFRQGLGKGALSKKNN